VSAHKHTPGPWKVGQPYGCSIYDSHGKRVAKCFEVWTSPLRPLTECKANGRLISAAPDHALICWAICVGSARWEPWGDLRGEFCMNGLRHATELDEFGCPIVTGGMRAAILRAMGEQA